MTQRMNKPGGRALAACLFAALAACKNETSPEAGEAKAQDESEIVTNRIAIPETVRRNLGITFAKVERRRVAKTLRVPGSFEHQAAARAEYHTPLAGRIELIAKQYQEVKKGEPLYRLDAPEWRKLQQELAEAEQAGAYAGQRLSAGRDRIKSIQNEVEVVQQRIAQLEKLEAAAGGRAAELAEARGKLAEAQTELAQAEEDRAQAELENVRLKAGSGAGKTNARFEQALRVAATWTGLTENQLLEKSGAAGGTAPRWKTLELLEVAAHSDGYVESVAATTGGWVKEGDMILSAVDHRNLIFRGRGLQSDLGVLRNGQAALIVPPQGGTINLQDAMEAELHIGLDADPRQRTIDLILSPKQLAMWARPGVSAFAEVVIDESAGEETAIPLSCVMTDGLDKVVFLRDREKPDEAIRLTADLGAGDGRWVAVRSGVKAGDEVVLDGAYELKLTGAGKAQKGGHFHSDGTFHEAHEAE